MSGVRKHDSFTGRFITPDGDASLIFEKYAGWSPYHYSLDNPVSYLDGNGLHPMGSELWQTMPVNADVAALKLESLTWTDFNDYTVIGTKLLSSFGILDNTYNIDGSIADNTDVAYAAAGIAIPFAAGSLFRQS